MSESPRGRASNGRSSIHCDSKGRWHGYVSVGVRPDGRPLRRHVSGKTRTDVTGKVKGLETERDTGRTTVPGRRPTLAAYLIEWIERRAAFGARPKTLAGYRTDLRHVEATIGSIRVDRLVASNIERMWKSMIDAGVLGSIAHVRRTVSAALNEAMREGLLVRNPVIGTRVPKHTPPKIVPFSIPELQRFLAIASPRRNGPRWTISALLGLRQGEVLGLCWSDIDFDAGTLTIARQIQRRPWEHGCADRFQCGKRGADCPLRSGGGLVASAPKSEAGRRTISLPMPVVRELANHRRAQLADRLAASYWFDGDWVFATTAGAPIDHRRDWAEYKALLAEAGLRAARLHDLRHSAATLLLDVDTDLKTAGQILGHGSIAQTSAYMHVLAERRQATAIRIEARIWGTASDS